MVAWAEAMAEEWSDSGYLFKAVEDGGLGVTQARFRTSGNLTESGGMPAAEYQRQLALAAAENHVEYNRTGAGVTQVCGLLGGSAVRSCGANLNPTD